jgi:uncharacterized protein
MNATANSVFQFKKMLKNLDKCMTKASAFADHKKFDVNILTTYRLAPDMFDFVKQVQSSCDVAKFCAAYLSAQTAPKHEDTETTWAQLHERVQKVVTYLDGFKAADFENASKAKVKPGWAKGQWIEGDNYLNEVAIPNFYFHIMAAYAILRHAGVDIGKQDYLGELSFKS